MLYLVNDNTLAIIKRGLNYFYVKDDCQEKRCHGTVRDSHPLLHGVCKLGPKREAVVRSWRSQGPVRCRQEGCPAPDTEASEFLGAALKLNTWGSQSNTPNTAYQTTTAHTTMLGNLPTLLLEKRQDQELPIKRANFSLCMGYKRFDGTNLIFAAQGQ